MPPGAAGPRPKKVRNKPNFRQAYLYLALTARLERGKAAGPPGVQSVVIAAVAVSLLALFTGLLHADDPLNCNLSQYRPVSGLQAAVEHDTLAITWDGAQGSNLRLRFAIDEGRPIIRQLDVRKKGGRWATLGQNLSPEFGVTTGVRRSGHGLPEDRRWWVYWDAPLSIPGAGRGNSNLPRKPEEVRRSRASYQATSCEVKTDGARLEVSFPGLSMGIFSGKLQFTVYRGTNLLRQEVIAKTEEPSVAYIYHGGLKGFSTEQYEQPRCNRPCLYTHEHRHRLNVCVHVPGKSSASDLPGRASAQTPSGSSPPGRHLVLDPEYLAERQGHARAQQAAGSYERTRLRRIFLRHLRG